MRCTWPSTVCVLALTAMATAQPTAMTYQGRLKSGSEPASGRHDFRFRLYDAAQGGTQLGELQCVNDVAVADGLFVASIDFGQQFASPDPRFLEIHVRADAGLGCSNGAGFTILYPRQPLTQAPRASHANSAFALDAADGGPTGAVFVDAVGNVGIGITAPTARLDVRGGPIVVESVGDQADLFWLASERSWVFRQEGSGSGTALKLESVGGGGNKNFIIDTDGFMGVGTTSPTAKLDVRGDVRMVPQGRYSAAGSSEENLRIVRGVVRFTGEVTVGRGFTCPRYETGKHLIILDAAFGDIPTIVATPARPFDDAAVVMVDYQSGRDPTPRQFHMATRIGGSFQDMGFNFVAVGPR